MISFIVFSIESVCPKEDIKCCYTVLKYGPKDEYYKYVVFPQLTWELLAL